MIAFGPVPSRRLGRSLGINNIPPKVCTYSCIYCQVGRTMNMQVDRRAFHGPEDVVQQVVNKVEKAREMGEPIDYLTFVPDGEATLDVNLGREIELLKPLGLKIAVISNGTVISRLDVRDELMEADWVSLKVDAISERTWRRANRPHRALSFDAILNGMLEFAESYSGELVTETMLVRGVNDSDGDAAEVAEFLADLAPTKVYLSIPTRPPAQKDVQLPSENVINLYYWILRRRIDHVEYLIGYEGNAFASTGDVAEDLLSITAVHPMREEAVREFLVRAHADWSVVRGLVEQGQLVVTEHEGRRFYLRKLQARPSRSARCPPDRGLDSDRRLGFSAHRGLTP
ncbi:MAG: radical SAM protein [Deltaproteobacteria bacterium]|nr:radical SAM protein [Deltaproteobacteria bacterium]